MCRVDGTDSPSARDAPDAAEKLRLRQQVTDVGEASVPLCCASLARFPLRAPNSKVFKVARPSSPAAGQFRPAPWLDAPRDRACKAPAKCHKIASLPSL